MTMIEAEQKNDPIADEPGIPADPGDDTSSTKAEPPGGEEECPETGDGTLDPETPAPTMDPDDAEAENADTQITTLESALADMKDQMLRAVAEQENIRRRAQKDIENATRRSIKRFAGDMLAIADNLRRALESVATETSANGPADNPAENPAIRNVLVGVEMTERELMNVFGRHGITRMQPVGEAFDPNFHEALFEVPDESRPAGTVAQVIETGYIIQGQPLRAAKVGVTRGGSRREKPEAAKAPNDAIGAATVDGDAGAERPATSDSAGGDNA